MSSASQRKRYTPPPGLVSGKQLVGTGLITERQLNHWAARGYINHVARQPHADSGTPRWYTREQGEIALTMAKLVALGFRPDAAAPIAEKAVSTATNTGLVRATIMVSDDLMITIRTTHTMED